MARGAGDRRPCCSLRCCSIAVAVCSSVALLLGALAQLLIEKYM
jgi:hypothetical protein